MGMEMDVLRFSKTGHENHTWIFQRVRVMDDVWGAEKHQPLESNSTLWKMLAEFEENLGEIPIWKKKSRNLRPAGPLGRNFGSPIWWGEKKKSDGLQRGLLLGPTPFNCKTMTAASTSLAILHGRSYYQRPVCLFVWKSDADSNTIFTWVTSKTLVDMACKPAKISKPLRFDLSKCTRRTCQEIVEWF